jgi:hypothetical protein
MESLKILILATPPFSFPVEEEGEYRSFHMDTNYLIVSIGDVDCGFSIMSKRL